LRSPAGRAMPCIKLLLLPPPRSRHWPVGGFQQCGVCVLSSGCSLSVDRLFFVLRAGLLVSFPEGMVSCKPGQELGLLPHPHCQIWTQLPHLDFPIQANTARTTQPDFSQRIDTVFFKRHVDDWKARIKTQIQGDLDDNPTGQALADLIHKEQKILTKEVRWLQDKAWKARRKAGERKEYRNKTQNTLLKRISLLTTALSETAPLQPQDRMKGATKKAMQGLGFLHLQTTFQKLVKQHDRWKALLRAEIGKAESLIAKENLNQNRRDDRRDIGRKNEIFKHGIKGIKKITGKYN